MQGGELQSRIIKVVEPYVDYLITCCFPSGNLPSSLESRDRDRLVQWCHGAPGLVHLLAQAYKVNAHELGIPVALCRGVGQYRVKYFSLT